MQTIKTFLDQSLLVWKDSTAAARFGIILLLIICFGAIAGVGIWSMQPQWVKLAENLDSKTTSELVATLDQTNVSNEISGAGTIVKVKRSDYHRAMQIARDLGVESAAPTLEEITPWMDPNQQNRIAIRNQESQLEAEISQFTQIKTAEVNLGIPERQPFLRPSELPSASVQLTLAPNQSCDDELASAIADHVANAVPGLHPDRVAITDSEGNSYKIDESLGRLTKQEEFRINRERMLAAKIESVLFRFLGVGNSQVEVSASFSFPNEKRITQKYDSDNKVPSRELIETEKSTGNVAEAAGTAGVANNVGNAGRSSGSSGSNKTTEKSEIDYKISKETREDVLQTPVLNHLSVAVAVNSKADFFGAGDGEVPADKLKSIEDMVNSAVGFREGIDTVNVRSFPFVEALPIEAAPAAAIPWDQINNILKNVSLGIAALVALFLGFKAIKNLQPVSGPSESGGRLQGGKASEVSQLSDMVKQNPEVFSKIIAAWANDETERPNEEKEERAA